MAALIQKTNPRLRVDEKWSVEYDPKNNDRPIKFWRYNEPINDEGWGYDNAVTAMFYALLAHEQHHLEGG